MQYARTKSSQLNRTPNVNCSLLASDIAAHSSAAASTMRSACAPAGIGATLSVIDDPPKCCICKICSIVLGGDYRLDVGDVGEHRHLPVVQRGQPLPDRRQRRPHG